MDMEPDLEATPMAPAIGKDSDEEVSIKVVVVGDGTVGKTCLLLSYEKGEFPTDYVPVVYENVTLDKTVDIDGESTNICLDLWDTAGQEEFDRLRHLAYRETDIFFICFDITNAASFNNVDAKWLPEVRHHSPEAMLMLIGTKCDLRNLGTESVSTEVIDAYRKTCGAGYQETSALKNINIEEAFNTAIIQFLTQSYETKENEAETSGCCIII